MRLRLAAAALAVGWLTPAVVGAQAPEAGPKDPAMARAPLQFRLGAAGGALRWRAEVEGAAVDDAALVGLDLASGVHRFVAFRLAGAYGRSAFSDGVDRVEMNQVLLDLTLTLRAAAGPLERAGVVPFAGVGVGSLVHDPVPDELATKSQNLWGFGAGVELDLVRRAGLRLEWRRYRVNLVTLLDPAERSGTERRADRFGGSLYWKL